VCEEMNPFNAFTQYRKLQGWGKSDLLFRKLRVFKKLRDRFQSPDPFSVLFSVPVWFQSRAGQREKVSFLFQSLAADLFRGIPFWEIRCGTKTYRLGPGRGKRSNRKES